MWGKEIVSDIQSSIFDEGDRINPYYFPEIGNRLLIDIRLLPLWTNISRDQFGYGRVPAFSASVESEFNKLKSLLLKNCPLLRIDSFIQKHVDYLHGILKLADVQNINKKTIGSVNKDALMLTSISTKKSNSNVNLSCNDSVHESCVNADALIITSTPIKESNSNVNILSDNSINKSCVNADASLVTSTFIKKSSSNINLSSDNLLNKSCPACQNKDMPSGAHVCYLCKTYVHALPQCSLPIGDEGYNQLRICVTCKNMQNITDIMASREIENWCGLEKESNKSNALYLGTNPHKIIDALICKKTVKIPIIKNGNDLSLKGLKIKGDNYTVANTCAFDSIFQILLAAAHDFKNILQYMKEIEETNLFIKLILHTVTNGISPYSYKLRAQILIEIFSTSISDIGGCKYINCETNVGYLADILL